MTYCSETRDTKTAAVTFGVTKFLIILILQLQASIIGWGKGEMAQFKGTVLRDFFYRLWFFSSINFLSH
jgi:hypothetical protein